MKNNLIELIPNLHWKTDETVLRFSIDQLASLNGDDLRLLIQPLGDKAYWENAALVLREIGYPKIRLVIPELLEWLADLNWPGANTIFELLLTVDNEVLTDNLVNALKKARDRNDFIWIDAMKELLEAKGIERHFDTPEMLEILRLAERA